MFCSYKSNKLKFQKAAQDEKDIEADITKREKDDPELGELKKRKNKFENTKLCYNLKVAIKVRDKLQLDNSITEFKNEKVEDKDMDLVKAERLLKELDSKESMSLSDFIRLNVILTGHWIIIICMEHNCNNKKDNAMKLQK